jgi:chemotaxis protein CheX
MIEFPASSNAPEWLETARVSQILAALTADVFTTMLDANVAVGEIREVEMDSPLHDGVVALLTIGGEVTGSGRLFCAAEDACFFAGRLLQTTYATVDRQVLDAVAELGNMIIGNLKTALESDAGPLTLSVPTVISGQNYLTHCSAALRWTILPFHIEGRLLEVGYFLTPTGPDANALRPPFR